MKNMTRAWRETQENVGWLVNPIWPTGTFLIIVGAVLPFAVAKAVAGYGLALTGLALGVELVALLAALIPMSRAEVAESERRRALTTEQFTLVRNAAYDAGYADGYHDSACDHDPEARKQRCADGIDVASAALEQSRTRPACAGELELDVEVES